MPKRLLIAFFCLLALLASIAVWLDRELLPSTESSTARRVTDGLSPGALYAAKFTDVQGNSQSLAQWDRKLLLLNFWATWCGPCREEMPILAKLQGKFGAQGLQIVGIAADSRPTVANFVKTLNVNYPLLPDEAGAIEFSKRLGNRLGLLPHTVMFGPGGDVIYTKLGVISEVELGEIIAKNLPIKR